MVNGTGRLLGAGHASRSAAERTATSSSRVTPCSWPRAPSRAPSPASTSTAELVVTSDELLDAAGAAGLGRGHRRRGHRVRVRVDDGRPRHRGDHPRGAAQDPPRPGRRRGQGGRALVQEAGHHHPHRRGRDRPRAGRRRATTVRFGEGQSIEVDLVVVSVGRRPLSDVLGLEGTGVEVDERGFVEVDEQLPDDPRRGLGRRRPHRHRPAGPRRLRRGASSSSRTSWARTPCRSTTAGCRGASTATPRSPSPASPRRRPRRPATTSSPSSTASAATAGPSSSASPTAW